MSFNEVKNRLRTHFFEMVQDVSHLFEVEVDKDVLWDTYLESFPEGTNKIFRKRREYDGSYDRQFIKRFGNVVKIKDNEVTTIWDFDTESTTFQPVFDALDTYVKSNLVRDVYVTKESKIGVNRNFEHLDNGNVIEWEHFFLDLPSKFVSDSYDKSVADKKGDFRDSRNVFKRSLDEISEESILTVLELIGQNSLYKGQEWKHVLNGFLAYKKEYDKLSSLVQKDNFAWEHSVQAGGALTRIRNHSIGTLLVDVSEGVDLDKAVKSYENIVAPHNYKRSNPIYSKKMLEDAQKKINELGYIDSLKRRFATLDDITINNILFSNKDAARRMEGLDVFEEMMQEVEVNPKKFSKVEEISIDKFINDVLPTANEVELLLENKHSPNMVSLIAPQNPDSKTMFKWGNGFSWAYSGNITDSDVRENVKKAGGNVEGVLRFSIQWNDREEHDRNDLDAHCKEPNGEVIYYGAPSNRRTTGNLDVDIRDPRRDKPAVENITWTDINRMQEGTYTFLVHNFDHRGGTNGFKAEIAFGGETYQFEYNQNVRHKGEVVVAKVHFNKETGFTLEEKLPTNTSSKEVWGLTTNQFVPVSIIMNSPNYWGNTTVGNKHYMFMLKDCINPEQPNGIFNEFLNQELNPHRKVMEALGAKLSVEDNIDQLSGVGFSSTKRASAVVKVKGSTDRVMKVKI